MTTCTDDLSVACRVGAHRQCANAACRCADHTGEQYVPVEGWLPAAEAALERRAYLDMDAAIERAYDDAGGF